MTEIPECVMIKSLKKGDMSAFRKLFDTKYSLFYAFVKGLVKDVFIAEDITQNVFMKVWINREKLNQNQSLNSYMYVIAKNEVRDHFRLKVNSVSHQEVDDDTKVFVEDFEGVIDAEIMSEQVAKVVSEMPLQRQKIFVLSREKMLSNKEIAEKLNLSVRTVERHIFLALSDIRSKLPAFSFFLFTLIFK